MADLTGQFQARRCGWQGLPLGGCPPCAGLQLHNQRQVAVLHNPQPLLQVLHLQADKRLLSITAHQALLCFTMHAEVIREVAVYQLRKPTAALRVCRNIPTSAALSMLSAFALSLSLSCSISVRYCRASSESETTSLTDTLLVTIMARDANLRQKEFILFSKHAKIC